MRISESAVAMQSASPRSALSAPRSRSDRRGHHRRGSRHRAPCEKPQNKDGVRALARLTETVPDQASSSSGWSGREDRRSRQGLMTASAIPRPLPRTRQRRRPADRAFTASATRYEAERVDYRRAGRCSPPPTAAGSGSTCGSGCWRRTLRARHGQHRRQAAGEGPTDPELRHHHHGAQRQEDFSFDLSLERRRTRSELNAAGSTYLALDRRPTTAASTTAPSSSERRPATASRSSQRWTTTVTAGSTAGSAFADLRIQFSQLQIHVAEGRGTRRGGR